MSPRSVAVGEGADRVSCKTIQALKTVMFYINFDAIAVRADCLGFRRLEPCKLLTNVYLITRNVNMYDIILSH